MRAFVVSFRNELDKLLRRRKYLVFLGVGLLLCLLWCWIGSLVSRQLSGLQLNLTPNPMGVLPVFLSIIIPFLMFMAVTDLFTVEYAENTMKASLIRPVERWKLFAAKLLSVVTYAAFYLVCLFVFSAVTQALFGEAEPAGELGRMFASYMLTIVPLTVLACFAALIAMLGKSGTLTMFLLLMAYLLLYLLPILLPVQSEMLFTSYLGWYNLWIGALPGAGKLVQMLLTELGYGVVFFTAASLLFEKKEY